METTTPLRVLIVDDVEDDALLAEEALCQGGYLVSAQRVETAAALDAALREQPWDLVLSDYSMLHFSGPEALALVQKHSPTVPFILWSGTIGEETAVAALKAGAHDYVMKGNTMRLVLSVQRTLREVAERHQKRRAEEALRASEERYRSLVETSPDAIALLDRHGSIQMANEQAAALFHLTDPRELLGRPALELLVSTDQARAAANLAAVAAGVVPDTHTYLAQRPDGTTFSLELHSTRVSAMGDDSMDGIMIIARDVTERLHAAKHLRFQARLLETVGQAIIATDLAGTITYWNQAATTLYGWTAAEVQGRSITEVMPPARSGEQAVQTMESLTRGDNLTGEWLVPGRDGTIFPALVTTAPLHDDHGVLTGIIGVSTDTTARKAAEEARRTAEERYRTLVEKLPMVTYVATPGVEGVTLYISPQIEHLTGFPPTQWEVPDFYLSRIHPDDRAQAQEATARFDATGQPFHCVYRSITREGRVIWLADDAVLVQDAMGHPLYTLGTLSDITERKEAEDAVRQSEEQFRSLYEQAPIGIVLMDTHGHATMANRAMQRIFGYDEEELRGMSYLDATLPEARATSQALFGEVLAGTREAYALDKEYRHRDGHLLWCHIALSATRDGQGSVQSLIATVLDLTEQRAAQERLWQSEEQYRRIVETSQEGIWTLDLEGTITFVNQRAAQMLGYSVEQLLGRHIASLVPVEDRALLAASQRRRRQGEAEQFERRLVRADGAVLWAHVSASPIVDAAGTIHGALAMMTDITERKQAETVLRQSEQRYRSLVDASPDGISLVDLSGTILTTNQRAADLLGYAHPQDLVGRNSLETIAPEDRLRAQEALGTTLTTGQSTGVECVMLRADGTRFVAEASGAVIRDEEGQPAGLISVLRDATARLEAEARIQRHVARLSAMRAIDVAITASLDLRVTLGVVLDQACLQLGVDATQVLVLNEHTQMLEYAASRGFQGTAASRLRLRLGQGHAGRAALERRLVSAPDLSLEEVIRVPLVTDEHFVTYFAMPLLAKGRVKGVLEVFHRAHLTPDGEWRDYLETLAGQTAIAIDNATLFSDLQRSNTELMLAYDTTIEGWSRALDLRDKETEGHSQRVTERTLLLAEAMGLSHAELVHVRRGALLHDIGKMGVPDAILLKPGALTEDEWSVMRCHPTYAFELLAPIPYLRPALDIPYCHHEKWDGTGYPRSLQGEQIPLAARLFAVVDVYDALTSDRPYRAAWSVEKTHAHLRSLAGTHFDPAVVETFLALEETQWVARSLP